jgi:IclR family KDG regulon transcriptional repressor
MTSQRIESIAKALTILNLFKFNKSEWGVTEIARELGMQKSTVFRLLATMQEFGFVRRAKIGTGYRLGIRLFELGNVVAATFDLRDVALTYLHKIAAQTGETVHLGIINETDVIFIESVAGRNTLKPSVLLGERTPLYCIGVGKAILAFRPLREQKEIINKIDFIKFTDNTIVNSEAFEVEMELTRHRGYAVDDMEHEVGVRCIAAPIRDSSGQAAAALSISGPSIRITHAQMPELAQLVVQATREISQELGAPDL